MGGGYEEARRGSGSSIGEGATAADLLATRSMLLGGPSAVAADGTGVMVPALRDPYHRGRMVAGDAALGDGMVEDLEGTSSGRARSNLGSPYFRPTMAGQANRPGGVFDRLSNPQNFTGVYRRAFFTDGRMNAYADTGVSAIPTRFTGDTNTRSDEHIHSIQVLLRPNLRTGKTFR